MSFFGPEAAARMQREMATRALANAAKAMTPSPAMLNKPRVPQGMAPQILQNMNVGSAGNSGASQAAASMQQIAKPSYTPQQAPIPQMAQQQFNPGSVPSASPSMGLSQESLLGRIASAGGDRMMPSPGYDPSDAPTPYTPARGGEDWLDRLMARLERNKRPMNNWPE